jgi:Sap, sulfolipid-1-addressing protein
MSLALLAGLTEVATMVPYLAVIGILTTSGLGPRLIVGLLAGYCVVMIVPACALLTARVTARNLVEPVLRNLNNWIMKHGYGATGWILAIAGFLVARDAGARLFFPKLLGE